MSPTCTLRKIRPAPALPPAGSTRPSAGRLGSAVSHLLSGPLVSHSEFHSEIQQKFSCTVHTHPDGRPPACSTSDCSFCVPQPHSQATSAPHCCCPPLTGSSSQTNRREKDENSGSCWGPEVQTSLQKHSYTRRGPLCLEWRPPGCAQHSQVLRLEQNLKHREVVVASHWSSGLENQGSWILSWL